MGGCECVSQGSSYEESESVSIIVPVVYFVNTFINMSAINFFDLNNANILSNATT